MVSTLNNEHVCLQNAFFIGYSQQCLVVMLITLTHLQPDST